MSDSYNQIYAGYPAEIFATAWQSAAWLSKLLASGTAPATSIAEGALACFQTFTNGADAVAAWEVGVALAQEQINLAAVQALPLSLDITTQTYFTARVDSIENAASGIPTEILPAVSPYSVANQLTTGQPAIGYPGYLEWCMGFTAETPPSGLTTATLVPFATGMATAWLTIANAIRVLQGNALTIAYDTAARQYRVSSVVAASVENIGTFAQTDLPALWNGTVAVPSLLLNVGSLTASPALLGNQQASAIRFTMRSLALQVAYLLLSLQSSIGNVVTAALRRNESLMDLAARAAGGYEEWATIATLNTLTPPYPGPTNQSIATSGISLLLPGSVTLPSGAVAPTYEANTLGIDFDFGPINGPPPPWLGDIPLIVGYRNYQRALGRRIQTPLGTLIYHPTYGSRIPPEVGAIQSVDEAARLAAFGTAALASDPRTAYVVQSAATVQPGRLATFSGICQPIGPGAVPVSVNQVISPLP